MPASLTNCGPMTDPVLEVTEDAFLGGQLRLRQLKSGHRAGHDASAAGGGDAGPFGRPRRRSRRRRRRRGPGGCQARRPASIWCWSRSMRRWRASRAPMRTANAIHADVIVLDVEICRRQPLPLPDLAPDSVDVGADESAVQRSRAASRLAGHGARDRACGDRNDARELDSRGAAHPQIQAAR